MHQLDPMAPVLREITNTFTAKTVSGYWEHGGRSTAIFATAAQAQQNERWLRYDYWSDQVMVLLHDRALQKRALEYL